MADWRSVRSIGIGPKVLLTRPPISRSRSSDQRRRRWRLRTAMPIALRCPTSTASRFS